MTDTCDGCAFHTATPCTVKSGRKRSPGLMDECWRSCGEPSTRMVRGESDDPPPSCDSKWSGDGKRCR